MKNKGRLALHEELINVFVRCGEMFWSNPKFPDDIEQEARRHVYFQQPSKDKIVYPCIIYSLSKIEITHADDVPYFKDKAYTVTLVDPDPDTPLTDYIEEIPQIRFDRHFTTSDLHHFVYTIYY